MLEKEKTMYNIFNQPITNIKNKMSEDDNKKVDKKGVFLRRVKSY